MTTAPDGSTVYAGGGKWQKKPITVDAFQFTGDAVALQKWLGETEVSHGTASKNVPMQFHEAVPAMLDAEGTVIRERYAPYLIIFTLEGEMRGDVNDFIIRGVQGEYYPCKPEIFFMSYDAIDDDGVVLTDELLAQAEHITLSKVENS